MRSAAPARENPRQLALSLPTEAARSEPQAQRPANEHAAPRAAAGRANDDASAPDGATRLRARLRRALGDVDVRLHDNRHTMLSMQRRADQRVVRLHHMFVDAPPSVVDAVGRYLERGDPLASKLIDRYIVENQRRIRQAPVAPGAPLIAAGRVHDLAAIERELSEQYFDGAVALPITWSRLRARDRHAVGRRSMRMGTYLIDRQIVRIHPALDQPWVPRYFVAWVVYHEMLHHVVPMPVVRGRKVYHSEEFRRREHLFEHHALALAWERLNVRRLMRSTVQLGA